MMKIKGARLVRERETTFWWARRDRINLIHDAGY
jgi:hypothetical protein